MRGEGKAMSTNVKMTREWVRVQQELLSMACDEEYSTLERCALHLVVELMFESPRAYVRWEWANVVWTHCFFGWKLAMWTLATALATFYFGCFFLFNH
jgi:hypothetical protein